jgi:threonine/homoserine/homoserine lactone efflux protein
MPSPSTLAVFLVAALALLLIPGPAVLYIVARGIGQGRRAALASMLGIEVGTLVHIGAAILGLSALVMSSAVAFSVVKYLGAAYLIYLGVRTLLAGDEAATGKVPGGPDPSLLRVFAQGVVVNTLNPKTALFFLAFLPQFVDPGRGAVAGQVLVLGCVFVALAVCTDGAFALLSGTVGGWLRGGRNLRMLRAQRLFAGTVYIGLGVTTAFAGNGKK